MTAEEANQQTDDEDYVKAYLQATEVQGGSDIDANTGSDISEPEPDVRRLQADAASLEMMTEEANQQTHDEDYVKAHLQATELQAVNHQTHDAEDYVKADYLQATETETIDRSP
jgi:hypothetical protein